jgi:ATP-dependent Clp protease ATP-binding subunit ClpC
VFGLSRLFAAKPKPEPACQPPMPHAERFTPTARALFAEAVNEARRARYEYVGTEHILRALARSSDPLIRALIDACGTSGGLLLERISELALLGPSDSFEGVPVCTPYVQRVIEAALGEARFLNHELACVGHLFMGLLHEREGIAWQVLDSLGITVDRGREALMRLVPPGSA